jgi:Ca2+-binding RTX toxin-like protein
VDVLNGEDGDDVFVPFLASGANASDCRDTFNGGAGTDSVLYTFRTNAVRASPSGAATSGESGEADTIGGDVEIVFGGSGDDVLSAGYRATALFGCGGNDDLQGGSGDDLLVGGSGDDLMNGFAGNDRFVEKGSVPRLEAGAREATPPTAFDPSWLGCTAASGAVVANGAGADRMNGGIGVEDTLDYGPVPVSFGAFALVDAGARTAALTVTLCASSASSSAAATPSTCNSGTAGGDGEAGENDDAVNVTRVYGGSGDDVLNGAATNDQLYGYGGDDRLNGGDGCDTLVGGAHGNGESNVLNGGSGDDVCIAAGSGAGASVTGCELTP